MCGVQSHLVARDSGGDLPGRSVEQGSSDAPFSLRDGPAERRLADRDLLGRPGEVLRAMHRFERSEVMQGQIDNHET